MKIPSTVLFTALLLAGSNLPARAQEEKAPAAAAPEQSSPAEAPEKGNRERRWNGNMEEFRQRMNERLKASLKVTDEEWTAIEPLIDKVQNKLMATRFAGMNGRRGGNNAAGQPPRPGAAENEALRKALESESTPPEELKAKLTAVREQRKKAAAELESAREELRKVLTVRQEAALVSIGLLD